MDETSLAMELYARSDIEGKITLLDVDSDSVTIELSGFSTPPSGRYHYEVAIGENLLAEWVDIGKNTRYTRKGLKPKTKYTVWAKIIRGFADVATATPVSFVTPEEQSSVYVTVGKKPQKGKVFVKVNGKNMKARKIFVRTNGNWEVSKS